MSSIADPTSWTDREREFFALGWNECVKMQPGEIERLRAALKPFADAVYNDNGDMTISPASLDAYRKAYFVLRGHQQRVANGE